MKFRTLVVSTMIIMTLGWLSFGTRGSAAIGIQATDDEAARCFGGTTPNCTGWRKLKCEIDNFCGMTIDSYEKLPADTKITADTSTSVYCGSKKGFCGIRFVDLAGCNRK